PVRYSAMRVARPMHSSRRPDANGSSVPVCPMRRVPRLRRARVTISWDVGPTGLSTGSTPSIASAVAMLLFVLTAVKRQVAIVIHGIAAARARFAQKLLDVHRVAERIVVAEVELRCAPDMHAPADLGAQKAGGGAQPLGRAAPVLILAHHAVEDLRVVEIGTHLDVGDGHDTDARIAHVALEQLRQLAPDLL